MSNKIQLKNSSTAESIPTISDLDVAELAYNTNDAKLYAKKTVGGTSTIVQIAGDGVDGDVNGPLSSTDNAVVRFDGTTGKIIQNSSVIVTDDGSISANTFKIGSTNHLIKIVNDVFEFRTPSDNAFESIRADNYQVGSGEIIKYVAGIDRIEFRNNTDSGFKSLNNNCLNPIFGSVSGGDETDLSTSFQSRLNYQFTKTSDTIGRIFATARVSIERSSGGGTDIEMAIRLFDVTNNIQIYMGPTSIVTHRGPDWGIDKVHLSNGFDWSSSLINGNTYQIQLYIRKTLNVGPYYPKWMSLNYQIW